MRQRKKRRVTSAGDSELGEGNCPVHALTSPAWSSSLGARQVGWEPHSGGLHSHGLPTPESQEAVPTHCEGLIPKLPPQLSPGSMPITCDVCITLPHLWGLPHQEVLPSHVPGHAEQDVKK